MAITPIPPFYSTITQKLLNYFPDTDVRIRENPITIAAQLLNAVAFQMEGQQTRINREVRALNLANVPMNIDNSGVYYGALIPTSFVLNNDSQGNLLPPSSIQGQIANGPLVTLDVYDDTLPVPTRMIQDPVVPAAILSNPQLINITGNGMPQTFSLGTLPLPNSLLFQISGMGTTLTSITISITGELDPPAVWPKDIQTKNEVLIVSDDGYYETDSVWNSVASIEVSGLPNDCQFICYILPLNLQAVADTDRPFVHLAYRGISFPRYWQLNDLLLLEAYQRNRFAGYDTFQAYHLPTHMLDLAVEPNTSGLFLTDGTNLYYVDRRTPMPTNLLETATVSEPAYGINVWYDYSQSQDTTFAYVSPQAYVGAASVIQYRYIVEDPNNNFYILTPAGVLQQYGNGIGGWNPGAPAATSFPLTVVGTYLITLETMGGGNSWADTHPFGNFALNTKAVIDLSTVVPNIQGIAFDAYDKLWVWTGQFAIPIKISYDAYVWDASTRTIYATDLYTSITISNS